MIKKYNEFGKDEKLIESCGGGGGHSSCGGGSSNGGGYSSCGHSSEWYGSDQSLPSNTSHTSRTPREEMIARRRAAREKIKTLCGECGEPLLTGAKFCHSCGTKI